MSSQDEDSIYRFSAVDIHGKEVRIEDIATGKVTLIVNVASQCGFTPQYEGLQRLYDEYKDRGFTVIAFPSNEFGGQEPGTDEEIESFACGRYKVTFPLMTKVHVNGAGEHPLFHFMKRECRGLLWTSSVKWNFTKFLCDRKGKVLERFSPITSPDALRTSIEAELGRSA